MLSNVRIKFWFTTIEFPQASITEYFLMIVSVQPKTFGVESDTNATLGVEQLSFAETNAIFGIGKATLQS